MSRLTVLFFAILLAGCSSSNNMIPFTNNLQTRFALSDEDLKNIQFYNDIEIVLYRKLDHSKSLIDSGSIDMVQGRWIEKVVIKPLTPGILIDKNEKGQLLISFEEGPDQYLVFGKDDDYPEKITIYGRNWQNNSAFMDYGGKTYKLAPQSADVNLLIKYNNPKTTKVFTRTATGRTIENPENE